MASVGFPVELYGTPLPVEIFGGRVTEIAPSDLPQGASPNCQDVIFPPGSVKTRPGLASQFTAFAGNPTVNYLRTFTDNQDVDHLLMFDSLGVMRQETPAGGAISTIGTMPLSQMYCDSDTLFGREYQAFSDGKFGRGMPRQFDGTNWDRISQGGPGAAPTATNFLPSPATLSNTGAGAPVTIAAAPTGAVTTDLVQGSVFVTGFGWFSYSYYSTATYTTTAAHGLSVNQIVNIAGVSPSFFNVTGAKITTVPSSTTFKISLFSSTLQTGGGGTVTPQAPALNRSGNVVTATCSAAHNFLAGWYVTTTGFAALSVGGAATATAQGGVVTVSTASAHGIPIGATVIVAGMTDATFNTPNGATVLTVPTPTTFTYQQSTSTTSASGGTVSVPWNTSGPTKIESTPSSTTFTIVQPGPDGQSSGSGTATIVGNVAPGNHQVSVAFVTRQESITKPAPPVTFTANGGSLAQLTNVPVGPSNVVQRIIMFTPTILSPATTGPFFHTQSMIINDNTTTTVIVDFSDAVLQAGTSDDLLFEQEVLGECAGIIGYADRLFTWGERNQIQNLVNTTFDGGWNVGGGTGGSDVPLGWTSDATNGAGGSKDSANALWLDAYRITGNGAAAIRGMITQPAYQDVFGAKILTVNTGYGARVWAIKGGAITQGNLVIELYSPTAGQLGVNTIPVASINTTLTESISGTAVFPAQTSIPSDALLRVYMNGTPTNGGWVTVDSLEIFPFNTPYLSTTARASFADNPEAFNGVTGLVSVSPSDGQRIASSFKLLDNKLYFAKEKSLYWTEDDGKNEPSLWTVTQVSQKVGTPSVRGTAVGEGWAIIAGREGVYIFWGGEPYKISQELQPDWDTINWNAGHTIYTVVDTENKRVHIGAPVNGATSPNVEFVLDYRGLNTGEEIASHWSVHYSSYSGKILTIGDARKWTVWNVTANSAALVERVDGTLHLFRGNGAGNGNVYDQPSSQLSDDGVAINSFYDIYFLPSHQEEQALRYSSDQKLFGYVKARVYGAGNCTLSTVTPDSTVTAIATRPLLAAPYFDIEFPTNVTSPRLSYRVGTNAVGAWFQMTKLIPYAQQSPTMAFRGTS